jgi:ubiquinone/menaquinone biosynthesis C-methylase UbiE
MSSSLKKALIRQFQHPSGPMGALAGIMMARKNQERICWAVREMNIRPGEQVLEIGYGPGVAIQEIISGTPACEVTGIESSSVMHVQAGRRNRKGIAGGRIRLRVKPAEEYNGEDGPFDLVFAINAISFCSDPAGMVEKAATWLKPNGRLVIVHQVPMKSVEEEVIDARESEFGAWVTKAGLQLSRQERLPAKPNPVLFIEGVKGRSHRPHAA